MSDKLRIKRMPLPWAGFRFFFALPLAGLLLLGPAGGCARNQDVIRGLQAADPSILPVAPDGLRLGAFYVSALNEACYEAFPLHSPSAQPRAYCLRSASWLLLPDIYPDPPYAAPQRETMPERR